MGEPPPLPKTEIKADWQPTTTGGHVFAIDVDGQRVITISMAIHTQFPGLIHYICYGLKMWVGRRDSIDGGKLR